jgi:hypothetical protein
MQVRVRVRVAQAFSSRHSEPGMSVQSVRETRERTSRMIESDGRMSGRHGVGVDGSVVVRQARLGAVIPIVDGSY